MEVNKEKLPKGWTIAKLDDIIIRMTNGANAVQYKEKVGLPISRIETISNETIDLDRVKYIKETDVNFTDKYKLRNGDILFSHINSDSHLGKTALFNIENRVTLIHGINLLLLRPSPEILPEIINYQIKYLRAQGKFSSIAQKAVNQSSINQAKLKAFEFFVPPLNEQKRILTKLEQLLTDLDKGIEYLVTTKQQLKVYRQAVLKWAFEGKLTKIWRSQQGIIKSQKDLFQMIDVARKNFQNSQIAEWEESIKNWESNGCVGKKPSRPSKIVIPDLPNSDHEIRKWDIPKDWIWSQIGTICFVTKLAGFEYTDYVKYNVNGDLFVLKAENVGANGFKTTDFSKIYSNTVDMLKRSFLQGGELLIVFVGAGTGNVAMVPNDKSYFLGPNIGMARPYLKINSRFLEYQLQSSLGKGMLTATVKAVAQPSLSMGTIRQTPIVFTYIEEQNEVVKEIESRLSVCDKIEETIENSLQQAEALRLSIIKKAFEGKLVPQDPNDEPADKLLERIRTAKGNGKPEKKEKVEKKIKTKKIAI